MNYVDFLEYIGRKFMNTHRLLDTLISVPGCNLFENDVGIIPATTNRVP